MNPTTEAVSSSSISEELTFISCGEQSCSPGRSFGPAVWEHFLLYYCVSGCGIFQAGGKSYSIGPQEGFLILPGEVSFYQADLNDPWYCLWVAFSGTQAETHLAHCALSKEQRIFCCCEPEALQTCLHQMREHTRVSYSDEFYTQGLLYQWLGLLAATATLPYQQDGPTGNKYVNKAIIYMQRNYQNGVSISELSDYVNLNRCYLTSLFQRQLQISPRDYLMHLRISKACELLYQRDLPVNQIAHSCGYPDPLAFSKAFHKLQRCSPSEYRTAKRAVKMPVLSQF